MHIEESLKEPDTKVLNTEYRTSNQRPDPLNDDDGKGRWQRRLL